MVAGVGTHRHMRMSNTDPAHAPIQYRLEAQYKMKELESEQRRNETVQIAQNVERLKVRALAAA